LRKLSHRVLEKLTSSLARRPLLRRSAATARQWAVGPRRLLGRKPTLTGHYFAKPHRLALLTSVGSVAIIQNGGDSTCNIIPSSDSRFYAARGQASTRRPVSRSDSSLVTRGRLPTARHIVTQANASFIASLCEAAARHIVSRTDTSLLTLRSPAAAGCVVSSANPCFHACRSLTTTGRIISRPNTRFYTPCRQRAACSSISWANAGRFALGAASSNRTQVGVRCTSGHAVRG